MHLPPLIVVVVPFAGFVGLFVVVGAQLDISIDDGLQICSNKVAFHLVLAARPPVQQRFAGSFARENRLDRRAVKMPRASGAELGMDRREENGLDISRKNLASTDLRISCPALLAGLPSALPQGFPAATAFIATCEPTQRV